MKAASLIGSLASQLIEGQISQIHIKYSGEIANHDCAPITRASVSSLLQPASEEMINLVNFSFVATQRGIKISEEKETSCQNYSNLLSLRISTEVGTITISGTVRDSEPHIVQVNDFGMDIAPTGGYFLFCDHLRPSRACWGHWYHNWQSQY